MTESLEERVARLEATVELLKTVETFERFNALVVKLTDAVPDWEVRLKRLEEQMRVMRETLEARFAHRLPREGSET